MRVAVRRRDVALGSALLLALAVVVTGGLTSYRKIETFQPLGFTAVARAGSWEILDVVEPSVGLEVGDSLLLVNGDGPAKVTDLRSALARRGESELVVLRGESLLTLAYSPPPLDIDSTYLVLAAIACIYLFIGFYTLMRDQRRPALLFFVWCIASAAMYLITVTPPYDLLDRGGYILEELARIIVGPLTLHLLTVFPRPLGRSRRLERSVPFFYLPAAFLVILQADLVFFNGSLLVRGEIAGAVRVLDGLELLHLVAFALAAVAALTWRLFRTSDPEPQRQAVWLMLGTICGYLPFVSLYVTPRMIGVEWPALPTALTVLPLALVPLTFSYAILRFRLWDIGAIVRDTLSLSLTVLVGISGFALANLAIERLVPTDLALGRNVLVFLSGLMVAGLMVPTRRSIGRSLERLQYGGTWERRRALLDFGREILEERSLEKLVSRLSDALDDCLEIELANLLLPSSKGLVPQRPLPGRSVVVDSSIFSGRFWQRDVEPLSALGVADEDPTRQLLYAAGYRYAFPLRGRSRNLGVFLVGYRSGGVPLSSDDLDLLRGLLNQTALAIENAQLLDQVNHQLAEVVRLQEFSQGIIDSSPAGIAVLDHERRLLSANRTFARLVASPVVEIIGKHLDGVLPGLEIPRPGDGILETAIEGTDGGPRHFQVSTATLAENGEDGSQVLILMDVSQTVAMQQALVEKDRLAALGMLAAGVAHEVNTPITGISSYAQMMLSGIEESDPHYSLLKKIEKQTFRAARIVNNLLNFARSQGGEQGRIDIVPLLEECLDLLREKLSEYGIELDWARRADKAEVSGNDGELQQVFTNLLLNAIDAMRSGGTLTVDVALTSEQVRVAIEDTGVGIDDEALACVFEPFYSTKLQQGGTGLGLSIANDIIKNHGGSIEVASTPGLGSRFVVELPRSAHAEGGR